MNPWHYYRFAPLPGTYLCDITDITTGQVREFRFGGDSPFAFRLFIYNNDGKHKAYRNACPHFDVPLNHGVDHLVTPDGAHFRCMTHFALFDKSSGLCVFGPCEGESLQSIPLARDGNRLLVGEIPE